MVKVHTRMKRRARLSTHVRHKNLGIKTVTVNRPKTFATEDAAHKWAAEHSHTPGTYSLKSVKKSKRFQVVKD